MSCNNTSLKYHSPQAGFTLMELMLTLTIAGLVLGLGIPSFTEMIRNNRLLTQTNEFIATVNYIRSEAVKRGKGVTICNIDMKEYIKNPSSNSTCRTDGRWELGWVAFVDLDSDRKIASNEDILRKGGPIGDGSDNENKLRASTSYESYIIYQPTGRITAGGAGANGHFEACDDDLEKGRKIEINLTGRPQVIRVDLDDLSECSS